MAFERIQPSDELRSFLDPLKPGEYFDCGEARLYGIDEALEAEARRRGRDVGKDEFQLVATDGGLIFCRASIMFAIAARWKDLNIGRPDDAEIEGHVLLPITWPTHGDLEFTVSRRLGSNIFRRWLQLQAQATRRSLVDGEATLDGGEGETVAAANGSHHAEAQWPVANGVPFDQDENGGELDLRTGETEHANPIQPMEVVSGGSDVSSTASHSGGARETIRLDESDREAIRYATRQEQRRRSLRPSASPWADEAPADKPDEPWADEAPADKPDEPWAVESAEESAATDDVSDYDDLDAEPLVDDDAEFDIEPDDGDDGVDVDAVEGHQDRSETSEEGDDEEVPDLDLAPTEPFGLVLEADTGGGRPGGLFKAGADYDPLSTLDAEVADVWVDDRRPERFSGRFASPRRMDRGVFDLPPGRADQASQPADWEEDATADPFPDKESPILEDALEDEVEADSFRGVDSWERDDDEAVDADFDWSDDDDFDWTDDDVDEDGIDVGTLDRTEAVRFEARRSRRSPNRPEQDALATQFMSRTVDGTEVFPDGRDGGYLDGLRQPDRQTRARGERADLPVPEIHGARLRTTDDDLRADPAAPLDIRATLLAGRDESEWVDVLRRRRNVILALVSVFALLIIFAIGLFRGGDDTPSTGLDAGDPSATDTGAVPDPNAPGASTSDEGATPASTDPAATATATATAGADTAGRADNEASSTPSTLRVTSTSIQICHSNYGGCVPVAADVDCEGDGDGPAFQSEPVAVFGDDVYELDTDDDREACEPDQPPATTADGG